LRIEKIFKMQIIDQGFRQIVKRKWAKIMKCSSDTALRDLGDLVAKGILAKAEAGGRGAHYVLKKIDAGS
jgi:Fic family protein